MESTMPRTRTPRKTTPPAASNGTHAEKKPPIDLATMFRRKTAVLQVPDYREDDLPDTGLRIEVLSFKSEEAEQILREYHDKLKELEGDEEARQPVLTEAMLAQLDKLTLRWWHEGEETEGLLFDGEFLPCTSERKRMVYTMEGWEWLRNFVIVGFMRERNFFGKRPKTA
jgi:hypothetical protein